MHPTARNQNQKQDRKRIRNTHALVAAGASAIIIATASMASIPTTTGMAIPKASTTTSRLQASASATTDPVKYEVVTLKEHRDMIQLNPLQYYESQDDEFEYEYDSDSEDNDSLGIQEQMDSVKKLQRSTGSEILNDELQKQIDSASESPDMFLDAHVQDATFMEKVAMSSIPQQLPRAAVEALSKQQKSGAKSLDSYADRVTHEEELELARMIQRGVALHKLKADFESKVGREISRQEWTEMAQLASPKELRQQVSAYRRAKQLLVSANMGLVHAVVKKQYGSIRKATGLTKEELIQEGSLGLLRAAELFDPSRGLRFSTYATIWIKGHLSNTHVMDGSITLPQREKSKWNKIVKAHDELTKVNNKEPSVEEIARHLNMEVTDVLSTKRKMSQAQQVMSLDYEYAAQTRSGGDGGTLRSLENDKAFRQDADLAERTQMHADVVAALAKSLDAREARLMRLRYGLADGNTRSLSECAEAMGLSQTRVQQLAKQCLRKLREAAEAESLEEYLLTVA